MGGYFSPPQISQIGKNWNKQRTPHDPQLRAARRVHEIGDETTSLRIEANEEWEIQHVGRDQYRNSQQQDIFDSFPTPTGLMNPRQRVAENDQCRCDEDIPRVEEGQTAQHERNEEKTRGVDMQLTKV